MKTPFAFSNFSLFILHSELFRFLNDFKILELALMINHLDVLK
jgi:hypothetical protein